MLHRDYAFAFMLFDTFTFKAMHGFVLFCRLVTSFQEFNNIYCFFSQILVVSPSNLAGLFYCHSLLITVFASLTVVNMWGEINFVGMN